MAFFELTAHDVVKISVSAHACLLLKAVLGRLIDWLIPMLSSCSPTARNLHRLHKRVPDMLPRVISEQASLFSVAALSLLALSKTSVSLVPFGHQPRPTPDFLIRIVLCACAARYLVLASRLMLGREMALVGGGALVKVKGQAAAGESGSLVWDFLYAVACAGTTVMCLGYRQNLLLGMTLPFLELSSSPVELCRLLHALDSMAHTRPHRTGAGAGLKAVRRRGSALVACALCLLCRGFLPALFLSLALQRESPMVMDRAPLVWFVLSSAFIFCFQWLLIYRGVCRLKLNGDHFSIRNGSTSWAGFSPLAGAGDLEPCCPVANFAGCAGGGQEGGGVEGQPANPFGCRDSSARLGQMASIRDHPDTLTNDIYEDIALVKQSLAEGKRTLRDVGLGLLRPYDNRNISRRSMGGPHREQSLIDGPDAADKLNILRKKEMTKTWFMYKLLTNNFPCPYSFPPSSPLSSLPSPSTLTAAGGLTGDATATAVSAASIDPLVVPALFDASGKFNTYPRQEVTTLKSDTKSLLDNTPINDINAPLCVALESTPFENASRYEKKDENVSNQNLNIAKADISYPPFEVAAAVETNISAVAEDISYARNEDDPHQAFEIFPSATAFSDLFFDVDSVATLPQVKSRSRRKRSSKLSPDCVRLLGNSTDSSQEILLGDNAQRPSQDSCNELSQGTLFCEGLSGKNRNNTSAGDSCVSLNIDITVGAGDRFDCYIDQGERELQLPSSGSSELYSRDVV